MTDLRCSLHSLGKISRDTSVYLVLTYNQEDKEKTTCQFPKKKNSMMARVKYTIDDIWPGLESGLTHLLVNLTEGFSLDAYMTLYT